MDKEKETEKNQLLVENKEIVVPGQVLAEGMEFLPSYGTYRKENKIIAKVLGVINLENKVIRIIPLSGRYLPKKNDVIIGKVIDILVSGWRLDINSPYTAVLNIRDTGGRFSDRYQKSDISKIFALGDYVFCKITNVTSQNLVDVTTNGPGLRKLYNGRIIKVGTHKVPRIIGKRGSMVNMIKDATGCKIVVGQNGLVWIQAEPEIEHIAVEAIRKIEAESHIPGLTDRIKKFLEEKTGKKLNIKEEN